MLDQVAQELRQVAFEVNEKLLPCKEDLESAYYQGARDMLLRVAQVYEQRCPLAVRLFQAPVMVKDGG